MAASPWTYRPLPPPNKKEVCIAHILVRPISTPHPCLFNEAFRTSLYAFLRLRCALSCGKLRVGCVLVSVPIVPYREIYRTKVVSVTLTGETVQHVPTSVHVWIPQAGAYIPLCFDNGLHGVDWWDDSDEITSARVPLVVFRAQLGGVTLVSLSKPYTYYDTRPCPNSNALLQFPPDSFHRAGEPTLGHKKEASPSATAPSLLSLSKLLDVAFDRRCPRKPSAVLPEPHCPYPLGRCDFCPRSPCRVCLPRQHIQGKRRFFLFFDEGGFSEALPSSRFSLYA